MPRAFLPALALVGFFAGRALAADTTVAITQAQPIEKLDGGGHPMAVMGAAVGATYTLVKQDGDQVILRDATGAEYEIAIVATNYSPPSPPVQTPVTKTAAASPSTNAAPAATAASTVPATSTTANPDNPQATPAPGLSKDDADKLKKLNDALGISLLTSKLLWNEKVDDVAMRLGWPLESKTDVEESFRRYANAGEAMIFGASAYSLAMYGKHGKPTYISMIFANEGDFGEARQLGNSQDGAAIDKVKEDLADAVKKDAQTISAALTGILGESSISLFGNSGSNRDEVHRWDWNGAAFLLNTHQGEYCSIRIIPTAAADDFGTVEVTDRDEMRDLLAKRVVKRDNGDVIISQMPMVDQGPKGYCVPATWERYLRYMDVPADLYVLAIMGHSGFGGGTDIYQMNAGVSDYVSAYHRRLEVYDEPIDASHVARYIDQGLPLMWSCYISNTVEASANNETNERKTVTDWDAYGEKLKAQDRALGDAFVAHTPGQPNGHMRLIIGYNEKTKEIAISDSWGASMAERWMYADTANRISAGHLFYLSW